MGREDEVVKLLDIEPFERNRHPRERARNGGADERLAALRFEKRVPGRGREPEPEGAVTNQGEHPPGGEVAIPGAQAPGDDQWQRFEEIADRHIGGGDCIPRNRNPPSW